MHVKIQHPVHTVLLAIIQLELLVLLIVVISIMDVRLLLMELLIEIVSDVRIGSVDCVRSMDVKNVIMDIICLAIYLTIRRMEHVTKNAQADTSKTSQQPPYNANHAKPQTATDANRPKHA